MPESDRGLAGAGLGLRRALLSPLLAADEEVVDFLEVAPENWIGVGGRLGKQFRNIAERYTIALHGLSLDIGGPDPIDTELVRSVRQLITTIKAPFYSEHLSYCAADGHLYDLLPIPFTEDAVRFMELNSSTARLLELLRDNVNATGREILSQLAGELGMPTEAVLGFGSELLDDLAKQSIIGC